MMRLWNALSWQPLRAQFGRALLSVFAIGLGVALGLAIHLMNRAATNEMTRAARSLYGQSDLIVQGTSLGFDEALYPVIARLPGVASANPVVEVRAQVIGHSEILALLGRDLLRMPNVNLDAGSKRSRESLNFFAANNLLLSERAANALHVVVDNKISVQIGMENVGFNVIGIVPGDEKNGYLDIAAAQWRLGQLGKLTRIEINLAPGANANEMASLIEKQLPSNAKVTTPLNESTQSIELSRAYRVNLTALALVALFTGMFLVYATQSLAVMRRRREFALLHALGTTPRQQIATVIATGSLLGLFGATLGIALGVIVAKIGMQFVFGSIATGNISAPIDLQTIDAFVFAALGIVASVVGSVIPALNAARVPTAQALKASDTDIATSGSHTFLGIGFCVAAIPLLVAPPIFQLPLLGYVAIALILLGAVLCIPAFTRAVLKWLPKPRGAIYQTAFAQMRGSTHTATQSVAAILVSVSLMVAIAIMVTSLRDSFATSLQRVFPADIQMQAGASASYFDTETVKAIRAVTGVERISLTRVAPILLRKDQPPISLIARNIDLRNPQASMTLEAQAKQVLPQGAIPIWISVALADRMGLAPDDTLSIYLAGRDVFVSIRGVWRDTQPQPTGRILMDYESYRQLTTDDRADAISIWLEPHVTLIDVLSKLREQFGPRADIGLPGEYRARALRIFDGVFATTYVLLAAAIVIGMFGISVNASAQALARRAEFGVLRHLGFTRLQIGAALGIEGLFLGGLGMLTGLSVGTVISTILIYVVSRQSFHWTMDLQIPFAMLALLTCVIPVAAALTSIVSARGAMNSAVIRAVKEDW